MPVVVPAVFGEFWETAVRAGIPIGILLVGPSSFKFLVAARAAELLESVCGNKVIEPERQDRDEAYVSKLAWQFCEYDDHSTKPKTGECYPTMK